MKNRGFTLIELLVVIAIIGILSSVVLASLNSARDKGHDASIRASINNIRAAAEVVYDDAGASYAGVCANAQVTTLRDAATGEGGTNYDCFSDADEYGVEIQLRSTTNFFCINSAGDADIEAATSNLADGATACDGA